MSGHGFAGTATRYSRVALSGLALAAGLAISAATLSAAPAVASPQTLGSQAAASASTVAPTAVRNAHVVGFSGANALVGWTPPASAGSSKVSRYYLRISAPNSVTTYTKWIPVTSTSYRFPALRNAAAYRVAIKAQNATRLSPAAVLNFRQDSSLQLTSTSRPATLTTPSPVVDPIPADAVSVLNYGATGDGVTDDSQAIQYALNTLPTGKTLVFPAGRTFAHATYLRVSVAGTRITGGGTLLATNEQSSKVDVRADNVKVDNLTFTVKTTTKRWSEFEKMGLVIYRNTGAQVSDITINGTGSAGLYVGGSANFRLTRVTVTNTRSDAIHITEGSHDGIINDALVRNPGDDGIAVVSYNDGNPAVNNITINNPRMIGQTWGRAYSVVGGTNITWNNIYAERSACASVYIAAENQWGTLNVANVTINGGTITGANQNTTVDHGAILLYNSAGATNTDITVRNLTITNTRPSASRQVAIINGGGTHNHITLTGLTITNGPTPFWTNAPKSAYNLTGSKYRGKALASNLGWR